MTCETARGTNRGTRAISHRAISHRATVHRARDRRANDPRRAMKEREKGRLTRLAAGTAVAAAAAAAAAAVGLEVRAKAKPGTEKTAGIEDAAGAGAIVGA